MRRPQPHTRGGFTLIELVVVILILAAASAIVWPRLPSLSSTERNKALRQLAFANQQLHEHAAFKKKV